MPHAGHVFERVEALADKLEIGRAVGLRDQNRVEAGLDDSGEVVGRESRVERIDAHEAGPGAARLVVDQARDQSAGGGLVGRRDRIFEVEDQRIGAAVPRAGELALGVRRGRREASAVSWPRSTLT